MSDKQIAGKLARPIDIDEIVSISKYLRRANRILVVVDGGISFQYNGNNLSLETAVRVLDEMDYGFSYTRVVLATRNGSQPARMNVPESDRLRMPTYTGFRFNMTEPDGSLTINHFDQIFLFGLLPGNGALQDDSQIDAPANNPTSAAEAAVLKTWMDAGGGIFATGDHDILGASMCSRIPRVRRMRKWKVADGVPPLGDIFNSAGVMTVDNPGDTRLRVDTNRPANAAETPGPSNPNPARIMFANQGDLVPQRIAWEPWYSFQSIFATYTAPHPILCHPSLGPINVMPDHPHEGLCFTESEFSDPDSDFPGGSRPKVIAFGDALPSPPYRFEKGPQFGKHFPMISVYDGRPHNVGRVVVDTTWHHWMDINIRNMELENGDNWSKIRQYFVNVASWLAKSSWRLWWLETYLTALPYTYYGQLELSPKISVLGLGRGLADYLRPWVGPCWVREFLFDIIVDFDVYRWIYERLRPLPNPCLTCPPFEIILEAVFGQIVRQRLAGPSFIEKNVIGKKKPPAVEDDQIVKPLIKAAGSGLREVVSIYEKSLKHAQEDLALLRKSGEKLG